MKNWHEFFEDSDGRGSMSRLLVFMAFIAATPILFVIRTTEALSVFLGAFVVNYATGKISDIFTKSKGAANGKPTKLDSE